MSTYVGPPREAGTFKLPYDTPLQAILFTLEEMKATGTWNVTTLNRAAELIAHIARDKHWSERLEAWIEREFSGHGRAIRRKDDPPLPDEPYMSMEDAKELTRRAVQTFALTSAEETK